MAVCVYAEALQTAGHVDNPDELASRAASSVYGVGKSTVNGHRKGDCACSDDAVSAGVAGESGLVTGKLELTSEGGSFTGIEVTEPIRSDWSAVFSRFNLDPAEFVIADDTVRMSSWQQSKRTESGDRDLIWLYSYSARFTRRKRESITTADYDAAQARLRSYKLPQRVPGSGLGPEVAAVLNLADMQLHKPDGDGLTGTLDRLTHGLENFQRYVERQRSTGRNINEVVIVNNGDPFEGIAGNYANQRHTVKAGLREQMNTVLDVWEMYARELYPQFDKGQFVSVHCNHTAFGRQGGSKDSITGDEDTGSAFLAEALQRILRGRDEFDHVKFTIPQDEMNVFTDIAGVPTGFNHGHKISGNGADGFEKWLNGQVRGSHDAHRARIWITAHKHSLQFFDIGSAQVFQCPSCDGGSKWLRDMNGRFSQSGILALLIGEHTPQGWSDNALI